MSAASALRILLAGCCLCGLASGAAAQIEGDTAPIEITADRLVVEQKQKRATFSGTVDAVQGDLVLSADELRVHYRGDAEIGQAGGSPTSIRLIEAFGNVLLSSPEETAQGDEGVYDVATRIVTLEGGVVLSKDENVIKGDRLEYDLNTGRSQVFSATRVATPAASDGRVRAIFVPEEDAGEEGAGDADAGAVREGAGGGGAEVAAPAAGADDDPGDGGASAGWPPLPPGPKPAADG